MTDNRDRQPPAGWYFAERASPDYEVGVDRTVAHSGRASGYIKARISSPKDFGTLMQTFRADSYRGKRLRMSAHVKAEKIAGWAGLWMRVDGPGRDSLSFDNMGSRPIKGTCDWSFHEVVLDVPVESLAIAFGILLCGSGQAWVDDFAFEVVGEDVPTTGGEPCASCPAEPLNLGFEE
jgi:hypothetical protein